MSFSYTEKKRVRKSFEKISSVMELPNLLATQIQSYDAFLQRYVDSDKRLNAGLEQVLNSIFPIESHNGLLEWNIPAIHLVNQFSMRENVNLKV